MKIVSFDVGIKNMAYCVLVVEHNNFYIQDWGIINLMNETKETKCCNFLLKGKNPKICNKKAKYFKNEHFLCETHAKIACKQFSWIPPNNIFKKSSLNKKNKEELISLGQKYKFLKDVPKTKKDVLETILNQVQEKCLNSIVKVKKKTANDIDLISIGRTLKTELDKKTWVKEITHVIIENQISTIATRMKTLQGMLTQYFIMQDNPTIIEYISSSNKLKDLVNNGIQENNYQQHKKDSVIISQKFIQENQTLLSWNTIFDTKKKDDLADAFLQGIWYIKHRNIISYAENLKINCVSLS